MGTVAASASVHSLKQTSSGGGSSSGRGLKRQPQQQEGFRGLGLQQENQGAAAVGV